MKSKNYPSIVMMNFYLLLFWGFIVILFFSYTEKIKNEELVFNNVTLTYNKGKMDSITFNHNNKKYSSLCKGLINIDGKNLCDSFGNVHHNKKHVLELKSDLLFERTGVLIIKEIRSEHFYFHITKDGYKRLLKHWKTERYSMMGMIFISFFLLNLFMWRKRRN